MGLRKKKKKKGKEKKEGKRKVLCSTEGSDILRISKPSNKRERKEIKIRERLLRDSGRDLFKGILRNWGRKRRIWLSTTHHRQPFKKGLTKHRINRVPKDLSHYWSRSGINLLQDGSRNGWTMTQPQPFVAHELLKMFFCDPCGSLYDNISLCDQRLGLRSVLNTWLSAAGGNDKPLGILYSSRQWLFYCPRWDPLLVIICLIIIIDKHLTPDLWFWVWFGIRWNLV